MDKTVTFSPGGKEAKPSGTMKRNTDFGPYHIIEHLDRGGMGDVYKARHNKMERIVALKVLPVVLSSNEYLERFNSEAFAISRLQHQNVVTIYDYGEINHRRFIAMQYITGTTLTDLLSQKKKLSYGQIIDIAKQICRGLKSLHNKGITHRDIKSSNVMIDQDHRAFISDFGIAQTQGESRLTTTGMAMGTPEYMSPEQCQGHKIDEQSDIYSFGIVLFEMITGKPPFLGENSLSIAYKQVHEIPPLLSKVKKGIPPRIELIVAKCLKKDKTERYNSAGELLKDMDSIQQITAATAALHDTDNTKTVPVDSEQRITDRRGTERRNLQNNFNNMAFLLPALAFVLLVVYTTLQLSSSFSSNVESNNWIAPSAYTIPAPLTGPDPEAVTFKGQGFFLEVAFDKKNPGIFILEFEKTTLIQGMVFNAGFILPDQIPTTDNIKVKLSLVLEGSVVSSMLLENTHEPQIFNFPPTLGKRFEFETTLGKSKKRIRLSNSVAVQLQNIRLIGAEY